MAHALKEWKADMRPGVMSHDGSADLAEHIGNAVKHFTNMRDEPDGEAQDGDWLWVIRKEAPKSRKKIDLAMCACLAWEARTLALRAGVLKVYGRATW